MTRLHFLLLACLALVLPGCAFETDADDADDEEDVAETEEALTRFSPAQRHNLAVVNKYRARKNLVPLKLAPKMSAFAKTGSIKLSQNHTPHKNFADAGSKLFTRHGFKRSAAENQGDPHGWPVLSPDPAKNTLLQIDEIQKAMFDEGPGPGDAHGHYRNMMNPKFRRIGIGLHTVSGRLYLTNDFSE